ncbi:hypothetical protein M2163_009125 [Streptomyces sp. SAI-135]|uniref:hypothetical protein n=1 Tax=unclassified Streptomyces TaxID=2593676 RepID=UPI002475C051|nr:MULTISPECIES: hypothetical protein [unclassified Streptomyces]MDH6513902.1 hypothetical protein [Streptomyces sp. SAI-090]MDH6622017.1 hypothetical protein [Streptomyces sp. SAI-135]
MHSTTFASGAVWEQADLGRRMRDYAWALLGPLGRQTAGNLPNARRPPHPKNLPGKRGSVLRSTSSEGSPPPTWGSIAGLRDAEIESVYVDTHGAIVATALGHSRPRRAAADRWAVLQSGQ